ncbi:MAG: STAS domain-containing protein [Chitinispirillaceae bacterium]
MALEIVLKAETDEPVLELTGRIIDVDVKKFQRRIDQLYKKKEYKRIILDVTRANFIDSHGLGTIVYYHTLMQKEKRKLVILNANNDGNSYLNRLFELTNLDKVLCIVASL